MPQKWYKRIIYLHLSCRCTVGRSWLRTLAHRGSSELRRSTTQQLGAVRAPRGCQGSLSVSASAAAPPPPQRTNVDVDACRAQFWVCSVLGGALCRKGGRTNRRQYQLRACASRSSTAHPPPLLCAQLSQERQHKRTRHHESHTRGAGRGAARYLGAGDTAPDSMIS